MNVLEQVGLSESNLSDNAVNASFYSKVKPGYKPTQFWLVQKHQNDEQ